MIDKTQSSNATVNSISSKLWGSMSYSQQFLFYRLDGIVIFIVHNQAGNMVRIVY